jgi:hypothetical protein
MFSNIPYGKTIFFVLSIILFILITVMFAREKNGSNFLKYIGIFCLSIFILFIVFIVIDYLRIKNN